MNQPVVMSFLQRPAGLSQEMDCASGRLRAVALDQICQAQPTHVFHDVIERPIFGMPIVEDFDGIPVRQASRRLHFAFESRQCRPVSNLARANNLDGTGTLQELVFTQVNLPHPPLTEFSLQVITT